MNTNIKKLALHRETVRTLDTVDLDGVAGGGITGGIAALAKRFQDTVYRGGQKPEVNDTVYRGGGSKIIPL